MNDANNQPSDDAKPDTRNQGIIEAIRTAGSQQALAQAIGVTQGAVSYYLRGRVPALRAVQIEKATGVPRAVIRPDLFS